MNWGYKIVTAYLIFGAIIISMVVISVRQDVNLVSENYYQKELEYQDQIEKIRNFNRLEDKPVLSFDKEKGICTLSFPKYSDATKLKGTVHFFRPSSSKLDKIYTIEDGTTSDFEMNIKGFMEGKWNVKVDWSDGATSYYFEKPVFL